MTARSAWCESPTILRRDELDGSTPERDDEHDRAVVRGICSKVQASPLSAAVFDLDARRLLALSSTAREQLGIGTRALEDYDYVAASGEPDATGAFVELLRTGRLTAWRWRSSLPGGGDAFARGRMVTGLRRRAVSVVRYEVVPPDMSAEEVDDAIVLLDDAEDDALAARPDERKLRERIGQIEHHLARIAQEVETTGVVTLVATPEPSSVPGLDDLTPRQWEIVARLMRGERVPTIARAMFLSPSTVRNHLAVIYRKVGVGSQAELLELLLAARRA